MNQKTLITVLIGALCGLSHLTGATLLSEFYGDQPGADPVTQDVELSGTPTEMFDLWIVSIESDFASGVVDRASNITGTFDANGIAVVNIADLENPSFTIVLTDSFTGTVGITDVDPGDAGSATDLSAFGTILDAVGVIEDVGDPDYAADFGGVYLTPNASDDPNLVFREGSTGAWYYYQDGPDEIRDASGTLVDVSLFTSDPTGGSFGAINASIIPEPTSALFGLLGLSLIFRRRRK